MGQQQSQEKGDKGKSSHSAIVTDSKLGRRKSVHPNSTVRGRASPVVPSASTASAKAQTTPQHVETPHLQQMLHHSTSDPTPRASKVGHSSSQRETRDETPFTPKQGPMDVPGPSGPMNVPTSRSKPEEYSEKAFESYRFDERDEYETRYVPPSQLRPPRMPLPIADAGPVPDSPTLDPIDRGTSDVPIFDSDEPLEATEPTLRRKSSMMSTTTQDEDDIGDELPPLDLTARTVPTTIEWNESGHKVYVTGTFANWEKKYRMHRKKDGEGFATTINLPPGTHHLMFLVDESMRTTTEMPTAVDFSNFLVNYIEVATEDLQKGRRESKVVDEKRDSIHQIHPPMLPTKDDYDSDNESRPGEDVDPQAEEIQAEDFRRIQPQPLIDMDLSEDDGRYHQAARIISGCPNPPSLPMFLNRSLLNGYTPVKDDSSVLTLPNHTVLNHLMTSSVKNGVLATSVTTRYKKKVRGPLSDKDRADTGKYVTTISFKPVPKAQAA